MLGQAQAKAGLLLTNLWRISDRVGFWSGLSSHARGGTVDRAFVCVARATDAKLPHPVDQRCSLHPQSLGSAMPTADHPATGLKRPEIVISFHFCKAV